MYFDLRDDRVPERDDYFLTEAMRRAILNNYDLAATLKLPEPEKFQDDDQFFAWVPRKNQQTGVLQAPHLPQVPVMRAHKLY